MKALILAAGKGVRMMPLTKDVPKVLVPINEKPWLYYLVNRLRKAGYSDFGVVIGYKGEQVRRFFFENKIGADFFEQTEQLGTGHAVMCAKEWAGDKDFIVVNGDCLLSVDDLRSMAVEDKMCYVGGCKSETPEKYGVFVAGGGYLVKIIEKPKQFVGSLVNAGLYKFTKDIWKALQNVKKSASGEYYLTDAVTALAEERKVKIKKLKDKWLELGSITDIPALEKELENE